MASFMGYERPSGEIGIRNNTVVLSAVTYSNTLARNVADAVDDVISIYNQYGRALKGTDAVLQRETMANIGRNPNVGAALVVGYTKDQVRPIVEPIKEAGTPVESVWILGQGTPAATQEATRKAKRLREHAAATPRVEADLGDLVVGAECGGSDTTSGICSNPATGHVVDRIVDAGGRGMFSESVEILGGEQSLIDRATTPDVAQDIREIVDYVERRAKEIGVNINESNPVPDNIEGGLTTIEEKSIGAILKGGTKPIQGVLEYSETPRTSGTYFMDTPAPAQESMTGMAAGGANLLIFSTGNGNPAGNPIVPVIKVSGNPETVDRMADHIDVDISEVITDGIAIEQASENLLEEVLAVANGKPVAAELLGHNEFAIKRVGQAIM